MRVTAPNAWLDYRAYLNNDENFFFWYKKWFAENNHWQKNFLSSPANASLEQLFLVHMLSPRSEIMRQNHHHKISDAELKEMMNNYPFEQVMNLLSEGCEFDEKFPGNHISWWSPEKVMNLLRKVGFSNVYLSAYGQSGFAVMRDVRFFDNTMPFISFYVEAIK